MLARTPLLITALILEVASYAEATPLLVRTSERLAASAETTGPASVEERAARELETILHDSLRGTTTSLFVADADTGERVFSVAPDAPLNPASNVKLIATATALDLEGPDFRYWTGVLGDAPDDDGVVHGDLYLLGTYDPTLDKAAIDGLARQLTELGVRRLEGDVVVGESASRDGVFRSFVTLTITAGKAGEAPRVTSSPPIDLIELDVRAKTSRSRRAKRGLAISTEPTTDALGRARVRISVTGEIRRGRSSRRPVWIRDRALLAAHLLRAALRDRGVETPGDVHVAGLRDYLGDCVSHGFIPVPLVDHESRPLGEIIQRVNKQSTNWLADRIIMTTAARRFGGRPTMETAIHAMYAWLNRRTGLGPADLVVDTGSGLSYRTAISTRQLVAVVRAASGLGDRDPEHELRRGARWEAYRGSLAVGGHDGTLRYRFRDLDGTLLGKTGTLSNVVALSGVLEIAPERRLVFSIISNGHAPRRKAAVRRAQERVVDVLAAYLHRRA